MTRRTWAAILWTVLILAVCWTPREHLPTSETAPSLMKVLHLDKLIHGAIFAGFGFLWRRATNGGTLGAIGVLAAGVVVAIVSEVVQDLPIIGRDADLWDGISDSIGVVVGLLAAEVMERGSRASPA